MTTLSARHCGGGDVQAVENQVRRTGHQHRVLTAQRLALGAVGDHHRLASGDRRDLAPGGKPGAAPARQAGLRERWNQGLGQPGAKSAESCVVFIQPRAVRGEESMSDGRVRVVWPLYLHRRPDVRASAYSAKSARIRHVSAAATVNAQQPAKTRNHPRPASVPLPSACARAIGHNA